ncbi:MAG: serine/threonine protein kinase [Acidobacteria bacterium]|nr:MAG: serine/threonine protein kinase [Acidobacteriota bacterium]
MMKRKTRIEIVQSSRPTLSLQTQSLEQTRLKAVGLLVAVFAAVMPVRSILIRDTSLFISELVCLALACSVTGLLFWRPRLRLSTLRWLELLVFGPPVAFVSFKYVVTVLEAVTRQDELLLSTIVNRSLFLYVLVMLIYATFIPNSSRRTAAMVIPVAAIPVVLTAILRYRFPRVDEMLTRVTDVETTSFSVVILIAGATISIFGSHVIHTYRTRAVEAEELGQYRLIEKIASGGMGEVWKACHSLLARPAAIKLIRSGAVGQMATDPQTLFSRFELEAQATAELSSPHTVSVYDFGMLADGSLYYVMQLLEGLSFETLVRRYGPLPAERVVYLLSQACDSLAEAHAKGLVHRDIKPSNLMTCYYGLESDFVKVLDFGVVKRISAASKGGLTVPGITTGTPAYMAPEIGLGSPLIDHRADLYSLGCVAYFLLTGALVFPAENGMGMIAQHITCPPDRPSRRTELEVPPALDDLVMWCLKKKPEGRPASALELKGSLEACPLLKSWSPAKATEWWRLHGLLTRR